MVTKNKYLTLVVKNEAGEVIREIILPSRAFSTGSIGYGAIDKIEQLNGERLQCSLNLVVIGSKPKA